MNTEVVPTFSLAHTNDDRIQRHAFSVGGWVGPDAVCVHGTKEQPREIRS